MKKENIDTSSLAHTKWNCKYHIVFAPKYRRKVFFRRKTLRNTRDVTPTVSMERGRNHRGRSMSGPYTYVGEYPAQNECLGVYGIFERSKRNDGISKMGKYEVCIPKSRILVQGILR